MYAGFLEVNSRQFIDVKVGVCVSKPLVSRLQNLLLERICSENGLGEEEGEILQHSSMLTLFLSSSYIRQSNYSALHSYESKIWLCIPKDSL